MYKVFFNDRIIKIVIENYPLFESSQIQPVDGDLLLNMNTILNHFFKSDNKELILTTNKPQKAWKAFKRYFKIVKAAGGIVRTDNKYLIMFRRGKWDLPKGKIDKGESVREAALREVREECGIAQLKIERKISNTWHIYKSEFGKSKGKWILKKTSWFEMQHSGDEEIKPQVEEDITEVLWANKNECTLKLKENSYASIIELWNNYIGKDD